MNSVLNSKGFSYVLVRFDYKMQFIQGKMFCISDALSRRQLKGSQKNQNILEKEVELSEKQ